SWVTSQYDRYVLGNTVQAQPEDSGMVRIDEETNLGVAVSTDANANWSYLNPYEGVKLALLEACRNIATAGAKPLAVTNCLNFGSPEDPGVMWQFAETVRGLADACLEMGLPVTGGNVSFYNQTGDVAILPTPIIGVLGVIDDVRTRTPMAYQESGLSLYLIGETKSDFGGSEWAYLHGIRGGQAPISDLPTAKRLNELLVAGRTEKVFLAAHDLSQGGLAATLTEMALKHRIGAEISLENPALELFSETPGRVLVAVKDEQKLIALCKRFEIQVSKLGVTGGDHLAINKIKINLTELADAYYGTFPKLFG
ncbi:MAG: AIR synthase related protein, partial [Candidatus Nanopelagicaceae bacterium]